MRSTCKKYTTAYKKKVDVEHDTYLPRWFSLRQETWANSRDES